MTVVPAVPLGELVTEVRSGFASGDDLEDGIFQIRMNNLSRSGGLTLDKRRRVSPDHKQVTRSLLEPGDVLFNATNSPDLVGKSAYFPGCDEPVVFSNHFLRVRTNPARLDPKYLTRWLQRVFERGVFKAGCKQWVNQATFGQDRLVTVEVPLPSLDEQRRIAAVLDAADALRTKRRQAVAKLGTLSEAIFTDMFGDPSDELGLWKTLADLVRPGDTINYGVVQPGAEVAAGSRLIRVSDLVDGRVVHSSIKRIAPEIDNRYLRSKLAGDEILVSCVGSTGSVALASELEAGWNIARAVARIPLRTDVNREYVAAFLASSFVQRRWTTELRTVAQPTLNIKQIKETLVRVPDRTEQERFARRVHLVRSSTQVQLSSARKFDSLFASLQERAFRGEL